MAVEGAVGGGVVLVEIQAPAPQASLPILLLAPTALLHRSRCCRGRAVAWRRADPRRRRPTRRCRGVPVARRPARRQYRHRAGWCESWARRHGVMRRRDWHLVLMELALHTHTDIPAENCCLFSGCGLGVMGQIQTAQTTLDDVVVMQGKRSGPN